MHQRNILIPSLALCALSAPLAPAAPPANDNFASRVNLGQVATASAAGTTVEATTQAGEPDPGGIGGASVWYEWRAPADGWVSLDTVDHDGDPAVERTDTIIALFTGTAVGSLSMLGYSDDSALSQDGEVNETSYQGARLSFRATAGVRYMIAVHGNSSEGDPAQGAFRLCVESFDAPDPVVEELIINPGSVDVTSAERPFSASIVTEWTRAFNRDGVGLELTSPGGEVSRELEATGDFMDGTSRVVEVAASIPAKSVAGTWSPVVYSSQSIGGAEDEEIVIQWTPTGEDDVEDSFLIPGTAEDLTVENTGTQDTDGPALTAFDVTTGRDMVNPVPVAGAPETNVTVRLTIQDAGSGFTQGLIAFSAVADDNTVFLALLDGSDRISGNAQNGVYEVQVPFDKAAMASFPGVYQPALLLEDATFNLSELATGANPLLDRAEINVFNGTHPYRTWNRFTAAELANPAVSGQNADPDKDGVANAIEYALGRNPKAAGPAPSGVVLENFEQPAGNTPLVGLSFDLPEVPVPGARYYIESRPDGLTGAWSVIACRNGESWRTYSTLPSGADDEPEWITEGDAVNGFIPVTARTLAAAGKGFLRLRVEVLAP